MLVAEELTLSDLALIEPRAPERHRARDRRRHVARVDPRQVVRDPDRGRRRALARDGARRRRADRRRQLGRRLRAARRATCSREYERLDREYRAFNRELEALHDLPAETTDGRRVTLYANIGLIGDLDFAHHHGAEGVGLYRTEFPFLTYRDFPDEEEQLALYRRVIDALGPKPVTIRTLDLGADKYPSYLPLGAGGESVPRLALDPHLARDAGALQGCSCAPSCAPARTAACACSSR